MEESTGPAGIPPVIAPPFSGTVEDPGAEIPPLYGRAPLDPRRRLNPWFSMWVRPRATMRRILDTDPRRSVILLALVGGIGSTLPVAGAPKLREVLPPVALVSLLVPAGAILGLAWLYVAGFLLRVTGRWFEGTGDGTGIRAALAWSCVVPIWGLLVRLPLTVMVDARLAGVDLSDPLVRMRAILSPAFLLLTLTGIILGAWHLLVLLKCLGEAQRFSAWRALGAAVLAGLLLAAPVAVLCILAVLAGGGLE